MKGEETKLDLKYTFWYRIAQSTPKNVQNKGYNDSIQKMASFDTVEDFWKIFQHLQKGDKLRNGVEIQLFKEDIVPSWEAKENENGGRLSLKLRKEFSSLIWEELVLDFISDGLPKNFKNEINGMIFSSKRDYNYIQIWIKEYNQKNISEFDGILRNIFNLPKEIEIDVKPFTK
ncbi:MAG: eukaryotic translation initiation factor EIF4E family protein [archaeon]|nr:eukaryotic translation initiation factor EIF4E family protein [archaeon]